MAEAVKVIVRCRPMNAREKGLNCKVCLSMDSRTMQCSIQNPADSKSPPKTFTFDGAYFTESTTEQIYADIGYPLVEGVTEGYNGTIFAYGQTGCGKSFSMQGIPDPPAQRGIIPRAFDHLFETITLSEGAKYLVHASYLEIYNEEIRDLLGKDVRKKLDLKEHPEKGVYVQDLTKRQCLNVSDCNRTMDLGFGNRSVGATQMNAESSRSHSIFTIYMERCDADTKGEEHIRVGKLNLVDLAGSERQAKTGATGDRLKEATKINLSLSALGNVISALVDGKSKHIPYRDSKLTRLLQDSLGGNTKTLMVACLSPADNNYDETLSTLRYANRAKNIKNKPKINEDPKDAMLREYQEEIKKLKALLQAQMNGGEIPADLMAALGGGGGGGGGGGTRVVEKVVHVPGDDAQVKQQLDEQRAQLQQEYEDRMTEMKREMESEKREKQQIQAEIATLRDQYEKDLATIDQQAKGVVSPGQAGKQTGNSAVPPMYVGEEVEDATLPEHLRGPGGVQQAEHLSTRPADADAPGGGAVELGGAAEMDQIKMDALRRLQQLQNAMVGGEQAANEELKQKRRKKLKHVEERRVRLAEAVAKMDDDGIIMSVYDDIHEELRVKNKAIDKLKGRLEASQRENTDLASEFEFDRIDYLDTIRKQEQQLKLMQAIIEKIHPCLRRDCNYANLDKIKAESRWLEDEGRWVMPKMSVEKVRMPNIGGGVQPGGRGPEPRGYQMNGEAHPSELQDRFKEKLHASDAEQQASEYFRPKRTDKILSQRDDRSHKASRAARGNKTPTEEQDPETAYNAGSPGGGSGGGYHLGGPGGPGGSGPGGGVTPRGWPSPGGSAGPGTPGRDASPSGDDSALRAAAVHGTLPTDEMLVRKPTRLDALSLHSGGSGSGGRKKKKKTYNTMDQL